MLAPSIHRLTCLAASLILLLATACAKETSKEERRREEHDREFRRLQKAEGHYTGYVAIDDSRIVPLALDLAANRTPANGTDNPSLSASVKLGLFGGVVLSSNIVSFDWGNGNITVSLAKMTQDAPQGGSPSGNRFQGFMLPAGNAAALELRGSLDDNNLNGGVIDGPISGTHKVVLSKQGVNLFTEADHFTYQAQVTGASLLGGEVVNNSQLYLNRQARQHVSSTSSDLPSLPGLDASLRFDHLGAVPATARDVIYDPLLGAMDLQFGTETTLRITDIFMNRAALSMALSDWKADQPFSGSIVLGAARYGNLRVGQEFPGIGLVNAAPINDLPPRTYVGTYLGKEDVVITAIATLEYLGSQSQNTAEYPFPTFPKLRLVVQTCFGDHAFETYSYDMTALDQVRNTARLNPVSTGGGARTLDISYANAWQKIVGKFKTTTGGVIDVANPQLNLTAKTLPTFDCKAVAEGN